jgi:NDP-sugar pyrophosphorylase family protein
VPPTLTAVADLDLHALLGFHREHGALATMTVVRPVDLEEGLARTVAWYREHLAELR